MHPLNTKYNSGRLAHLNSIALDFIDICPYSHQSLVGKQHKPTIVPTFLSPLPIHKQGYPWKHAYCWPISPHHIATSSPRQSWNRFLTLNSYTWECSIGQRRGTVPNTRHVVYYEYICVFCVHSWLQVLPYKNSTRVKAPFKKSDHIRPT